MSIEPADRTVPEPHVTKAIHKSARESPSTDTQEESLFPSPEAFVGEAEVSTKKLQRRKEALAARMPAAFAPAARVLPEGLEDTVTQYAYKAYFCERATNASPEEPSTAVTAESSAGMAVLPVIEDQDVLGSNHHLAPDQRTYSQTRPDSVCLENPTTSL